MPVEKWEKRDFSKCQGLAADVCGISKSKVSRICKEAETSQDLTAAVFMSPRKNTKTSKMETNEDNFENNVPCRTMFGFYNTGKFPTLEKNNTFFIRKNILYRLSYFCFNGAETLWLQVQEK
jgi:hypothetical protein